MAISIGVFQIVADMKADPAIVAKAAEDLGFNSYWVPEHPILPVESESTYKAGAEGEKPAPRVKSRRHRITCGRSPIPSSRSPGLRPRLRVSGWVAVSAWSRSITP